MKQQPFFGLLLVSRLYGGAQCIQLRKLAFERCLDRGNALVASPFDDYFMQVGKLSFGEMEPLLDCVDIECVVYGAVEHRFNLLAGVARVEILQIPGSGRLRSSLINDYPRDKDANFQKLSLSILPPCSCGV